MDNKIGKFKENKMKSTVFRYVLFGVVLFAAYFAKDMYFTKQESEEAKQKEWEEQYAPSEEEYRERVRSVALEVIEASNTDSVSLQENDKSKKLK